MSSRLALRGAALLAVALAVTSCGSDSGGDKAADGGGATGSSSGAFPVTVSTAFGDVTVDQEPTRVVALGWGDAETALALGVQPVGASDWLAFGGEGVGPWAAGEYDQAPEIIDTVEPSFEAIAALKPDLILDTRSPATQERYDTLSAIAPTISQPEGADPYLTSSEDQLRMVGEALGKSDEAAALQEQVDQAFTDAAAANPAFAGTEVAVAAYTSEGFGAYVQGDVRVDVMEKLGFTIKPEIQALATDSFFISVSEEQLPLLDAGLTVAFPIFVAASEITDNPLWQSIPSVQAGHAVVLDDETLTSAFSIGTPQGIQYALDNAVPLFAAAR
jgi:iron complex transport system substrate-binding protein